MSDQRVPVEKAKLVDQAQEMNAEESVDSNQGQGQNESQSESPTEASNESQTSPHLLPQAPTVQAGEDKVEVAKEIIVEPKVNWTCEVHRKEKELKELQVGDKFKIHCKGEGLSESLVQPIKVVFENEKLNYALKILEIEVSEFNSAQFIVTSYLPGNFNQPFVVTDGQKSVKVEGLSWSINSILPKGQQPPPPYAGFLVGLSYPLWLWITLALIISILVGFFVRTVQKVRQRRKLLSKLKEYSTALSPFNQYNKDLRIILRKVSFASQGGDYTVEQALLEIDKELKLYLIRELYVPAFDWTIRQVMNELKSRHRLVFDYAGSELRNVLYELRRANGNPKSNSWHDCEQLAKMSRGAVSKINEARRKAKL